MSTFLQFFIYFNQLFTLIELLLNYLIKLHETQNQLLAGVLQNSSSGKFQKFTGEHRWGRFFYKCFRKTFLINSNRITKYVNSILLTLADILSYLSNFQEGESAIFQAISFSCFLNISMRILGRIQQSTLQIKNIAKTEEICQKRDFFYKPFNSI